MDLTGQHLIAGEWVGAVTSTFQGKNPATGEALPTVFCEAGDEDIQAACNAAEQAFDGLRASSLGQRGDLLDAVADAVMALGDDLLNRAHQETGLPMGRLQGERGRAVNQTRLFANVVREGNWLQPRIDQPDPERTPAPKPDVRSVMMPLGPVAVFGASNFPLAIGVFGTDTISALGAGCPVVVKAHPAHPGTSELLARAIAAGVAKAGFDPGIFSMVQGAGHESGMALVAHPAIQAVAFTGSLKGGRALYDVATSRLHPIPFYGELGSINPVFILPGAMKERGEAIAAGYLQSVNLGVGQFCTNPGLLMGIADSSMEAFETRVGTLATEQQPATMLHAGILSGYESGVAKIANTPGVATLGQTPAEAAQTGQAGCAIFKTDIQTLQSTPHLQDEVFGPASIVVACGDDADFMAIAEKLEGHLSATVHATDEDLANYQPLIRVLERKVGRLVFNGFPTGIEVCHAMHHGGPYPATTDAHFTSIGTGAIHRFSRPICYQNFPDAALPAALQNANPLGLWRLVDGEQTQQSI